MKKNIIAIFALLSLTTLGYAQDSVKAAPAGMEIQRMSLGLRGGGSMNFGKMQGLTGKTGPDFMLDLQYAAYWRHKTTRLGFLVGASVGYVQSGVVVNNLAIDAYRVNSSDGEVVYGILSNGIKEKRQQAVFEIPVMFSLIADNGFFFNFGPRFQIPMWSRSQVEYRIATIDAYFPEEDVNVLDELVTGRSDAYKGDAAWNIPTLNLLLGTELGYEFPLKNRDALDLGLFLDFRVCSAYKNYEDRNQFIQTVDFAPAKIVVSSPIDVFMKSKSGMDIGVKLTYHFALGNKKAKAEADAFASPAPSAE